MDGSSNRTAGLGSDDSGGTSDYSIRPRRGRAHRCVATAIEILEGSNRQETQQARIVLEEALLYLAETEASGEG